MKDTPRTDIDLNNTFTQKREKPSRAFDLAAVVVAMARKYLKRFRSLYLLFFLLPLFGSRAFSSRYLLKAKKPLWDKMLSIALGLQYRGYETEMGLLFSRMSRQRGAPIAKQFADFWERNDSRCCRRNIGSNLGVVALDMYA